MGFSYQLKYLIDFVLLFVYTKSYIIQESIKYISYHMRGFHTIFMYKYSSYRMTRSIKTYLLVFIDFIQLMTGHRIISEPYLASLKTEVNFSCYAIFVLKIHILTASISLRLISLGFYENGFKVAGRIEFVASRTIF